MRVLLVFLIGLALRGKSIRRHLRNRLSWSRALAEQTLVINLYMHTYPMLSTAIYFSPTQLLHSLPVLICRDWQIVVLVSYVAETPSAMDSGVMSHILTSVL